MVARPMPSLLLDALHQHAAENIAPGIVIGDTDAGRLRRTSQALPIGLPVRQRRQQIDAGKARERIGHASAARARQTDRPCGRESETAVVPAASAACARIAAQSSISA